MKKFVISLFLILGIFLGSVFIPFCGNQSGRVYADEIKNIDVTKIFVKLGLEENLTPSRRNGMLSMVEKIKQYAAAV